MKKTIKILWLCHFANDDIKNIVGAKNVNEFAPWINKLIDLFKTNDLIELYIVAPNVYDNRLLNFKLDNVSYTLYPIVPIIFRNRYLAKVYYFFRLDYFSKFYWIKKQVYKIVNNIKPDLIHLHGAENPYYSAAILKLINSYKVLTTIQGFIRNSTSVTFDVKQRINIEEKIIKKSKNIGVRTQEMSRIVLEINPNAKLYFHNYPMEIPDSCKENIGMDEPIDCLYFARVEKDKGIEDLLFAISLLKIKLPDIKVTIIGDSDPNYLISLKLICYNNNIIDNVTFLGFLKSEADIYPYILKSKVCVLPTYHDILPGTILLSMFMKLPVVSYNVGGIPELNNEFNTISIVEKGDIKQLSDTILNLLNNIDLRFNYAEIAYKYSRKRFDNNNVIYDIISAYNIIL